MDRLRTLLIITGLGVASACPAATIVINGTTGFDDATPAAPEGGNTGTTLGQQRMIVFQRAAEIWADRLESGQTITVDAMFVTNELFCDTGSATVGSAGPKGFGTFGTPPPGALSGYWYPVPLLEALADQNFNGANAEISARFNADIDDGCIGPGTRFWYGIDPNVAPPPGTTPLLPVVLHELAHGLGFISLACATDGGCGECEETVVGEGCGDGIADGDPIPIGARANGINDVWDFFLYDKTLDDYWETMSLAERGDSVTNTGNLLWAGGEVHDARPTIQPGGGGFDPALGFMRMYAPDPAEGGSSVSHWAREASSPNLLMEPVFESGVFDGTDLTVALFRDIGWQTAAGGDDPSFIFGNGFE